MSQPITQPTYGTYLWFLRALGRFLQYGPDYDMWSQAQQDTAQEILDSGLMRFYFPPTIEAMLRGHEWSFLRPVGSTTTSTGTRVYDLPTDLERIDGDLTYDGDDEHYPSVQIVPEQRIRQLEYQSDYTSHPAFAAVRPKMGLGNLAQRQEIIFHPTPDSEYKLYYRYTALPRSLSATYPYPLGGTAFAEAIKASVLAEAELIRDGRRGAMWGDFLTALASSVATDIRRGPDLIGYNADASCLGSDALGKNLRRVRDYLYTDATYLGGT